MAWKDYNLTMPVQVCGIKVNIPDEGGELDKADVRTEFSDDGSGYEIFDNLEVARLFAPDLDPEHNTARFTWAMRGEVDGEPAIRFETWAAYKMYST